MKESLDTIIVDQEGDLTWITLNRPEVANAFNTRMAEELLVVFSEFVSGARTTRCVILTGTGERAFCAGGDLKQRHGMTDEEWYAQHVRVDAQRKGEGEVAEHGGFHLTLV